MLGRRRSWVLVAALAVSACGGSVSSTPGDGGGADGGSGGVDASVSFDTGTGEGSTTFDVGLSETSPSNPYDGTTGKACTSDADCTVAGGPGIARCSSSVFAPESYYPTPVCILPTCTPVSDQQIHYCDGPDQPSSPGICVPQGTAGGGICIPKCTYDETGDAATGCVGKDMCFAYTTGTQGGVGYCWGGCTQDGDCPQGQKCQTDQGLCVEGVVPPTKAFGAACTKSDSDNGVCNCLYGGSAETGYCSSFCITGGPATCPAGSICDGLEYRQYGFSTQNPGLGGFCSSTCVGDAETCPANSTCTNIFAAGPDCVP
jgi:hypothetical protein